MPRRLATMPLFEHGRSGFTKRKIRFSQNSKGIKMNHSKQLSIVSLILLFAMLTGCDSKTSQMNSGAKQGDSEHLHPFLELHKPKELAVAVARIGEIHQSLMTSGEFPSPIKVEYVEVIHGEGASRHAHFYLTSEYNNSGGEVEHDGFPGEEAEEDEKVKNHVMEITSREELGDLAGWLPGIAAKSSAGEEDWNSVSEVSKRLKEIIESIPTDATDVSFLEAWQTKAKDVESMLDKLNEVVAKTGGAAQ